MRRRLTITAVAILALLPLQPKADAQAPNYYPTVGRFGFWGAHNEGSPVQTGEFQSLDASEFWDIDGLHSDGRRTLDFSATGLNQDDYHGYMHYYGPRVSAKIDFDQYLRRVPWEEFEQFDPTAPSTAAFPFGGQVLNHDTLNAGDDYAFRVQDFNAKFKGNFTESLRWKFNVFGMRRFGERQAAKVAHCYNETSVPPLPGMPTAGQPTGTRCHVLAQRQAIDWQTIEFQPVIEWNLGGATIEYSRTMRALAQDDQNIVRQYSQSGHEGWPVTGVPVPYGLVTENYTAIDRIKLSADLNENNRFYGFAYNGRTQNQWREMDRDFLGTQLRLVNTTFDGLTLVGYGKTHNEFNDLPTTFPDDATTQGGDVVTDYHPQLNYKKSAAGLKSSWSPYDSGYTSPKGLLWVSGYEFNRIDRDHADYEIEQVAPEIEFIQPDTKIHEVYIGPQMRWNERFDTYLRQKVRWIEDPIYGLRAISGNVNTNQPEQEYITEIGGTWMPASNFMVNATFGIENRFHHSWHENEMTNYEVFEDGPRLTDFDETSYPFTISTWYAPTCKWSFTAGYAQYTNWIDQLITLGEQWNDGVFSSGARNYNEPQPRQGLWNYYGRANVVNLGGAYAWTERVKLNGGLEYTRSTNRFADPPIQMFDATTGGTRPDPTTGSDLAQGRDPVTGVNEPGPVGWNSTIPLAAQSDVLVETYRITAGVDYEWSCRTTVFFRYNLFDYEDEAATGSRDYSGITHLFLSGLSAAF